MANLPNDTANDPTVITDGYFEREVHLSRESTATFLHELADQIESGSELTVSSDDWKIPFEFREPIEIEVEFTSHREKELEIEIEFEEPQGRDGLSVG
ncbi:amphi-Trp domain-containing protein (plasmid) [Halococcus dombrowskii]|uniref:Amphi-Trp domain-containing protein n=1 Tax=Halococcus dombrowskii TaxID=179637 RepID=A0AAV3SK91_HALDO|nr:amphi-Trp domain-containing protein [Halococcus dombrowskii]UOO97030.1 amphi-Trp domain-containing protein [Halococcus dombrowskii]